MITKSIYRDYDPRDTTRLVLNFAARLWFPNKFAEIMKTGNAARIARYKRVQVEHLVIEPPLVFGDSCFITCVLDRFGGTLFVDEKIPCFDFDTFIKQSVKSEKINPSDADNSSFKSLFDSPIDKSVLTEQVLATDTFSTTPVYLLGKTTEGGYLILFDSEEDSPDVDGVVNWIFAEYTFQSIVLMINDDDATGSVTLKDCVLKEKKITFDFIDAKKLKQKNN